MSVIDHGNTSPDIQVREAPGKVDGHSGESEAPDQLYRQWNLVENGSMHMQHLENKWLRVP